MINREILYERNVMGSYMKIPVNIYANIIYYMLRYQGQKVMLFMLA